jgi:hypothetical protein
MKEHFKIMLVVVVFVLVVTGLVFLIDKKEQTYKYRLQDSRGNMYYALGYEEKNGCITFNTICCDETIMICGSYNIKENRNYLKTQ